MRRSESYQNLLWKVARKLGLDPATTLLDMQAHPLLQYLLEGHRIAWESWDWNDICIIEQRWFYPPYTAGVQLAAGAIIYDPLTGIYWQNVNGGDGGSPSQFPMNYQQVTLAGQVSILAQPYILDAPLLSPPPPPPPINVPNSNLVIVPSVAPLVCPTSLWGLNSDGNPYGEMEEVFGVYSTDPRLSESPIEVMYSLSPRGLELFDTQLTNVWVFYRPPFPVVQVENWSSTTSYSLNDSVYYGQDLWYASISNSNVIPGVDSTWVQFRPPAYMSNAVVAYAYARALEEDGQDIKAQTQDAHFSDLLAKEYDKQGVMMGMSSHWTTVIR